jgi:cell division protein FtsW (lipid II flippase)
VPPELVLVANFLVAAALLAVATSTRLARLLSRRSVALAVLPLLTVVLVTVYVFGEDTYRGHGISRWDAYRSPGGALGPMFVLSIALMAACASLLFYAGLRDRDRLLRATALAGALTSFVLVTPTILGFSLN